MHSATETETTIQLDPARTPANVAEQLRGMGEQEGLEVRDLFQTPSGYFVRIGATSRIGSREEDFVSAANRFFARVMAEFGPVRKVSPAFFDSRIRLASIQLTNVKLVSDPQLTSLADMTVLVERTARERPHCWKRSNEGLRIKPVTRDRETSGSRSIRGRLPSRV